MIRKGKKNALLAINQITQEDQFDFDSYFNLVNEFKSNEELEPLEIKPFDP